MKRKWITFTMAACAVIMWAQCAQASIAREVSVVVPGSTCGVWIYDGIYDAVFQMRGDSPIVFAIIVRAESEKDFNNKRDAQIAVAYNLIKGLGQVRNMPDPMAYDIIDQKDVRVLTQSRIKR